MAVTTDCKCKPLACQKCYVPVDQPEFYTEPCEGGKKVRSCARQKCVKLEPAPSECLVQAPPASTPVSETESTQAQILQDASVESGPETVGQVDFATGASYLVRSSSEPVQLKSQLKLRSGDVIETSDNGRVRIIFNDRNVVNLGPQTHVVILEYQVEKKVPTQNEPPRDSALSRAKFELLKGKMRSIVNNSYKDTDNNYYRVKTPAAVAGVRGTDFVTSYEAESHETRFSTLTGVVSVESDSLSQADSSTAVEVAKGESLALSPLEWAEGSNRDPIRRPLRWSWKKRTLGVEEQIRLRKETNWNLDEAERLSKTEVAQLNICSQPVGKFNSCYWTCKNNPEGESTCRLDLPEVQCIRRRCNANGVWAEPLRIPASQSRPCKGNELVVAPCDY